MSSSQIAVLSALSEMLRDMGYVRKYAFFIFETALLHKKAGNLSAAHHLLLMSAQFSQLSPLFCSYESMMKYLTQRTETTTSDGMLLALLFHCQPGLHLNPSL